MQIFVSNHLIPDDFEFSALDDPCYVSADEEVHVPSKACPHRGRTVLPSLALLLCTSMVSCDYRVVLTRKP